MANNRFFEEENLRYAGKISAKIISFSKGFDVIDEVKRIRISSKDYSLLIMEDYMSVIGEIEGDLTVMGSDFTYEYKGIKGFYKHAYNEFEILISEEGKTSND